MGRTSVQSVKEQMSGLINRYLSVDLDYFAADEISLNINFLDNLQNSYFTDDELSTLLGLVNQIVNHRYVARGYATPDIPRPLEYYKNMNAAKQLFRQINNAR
jgi:hypothetical protein